MTREQLEAHIAKQFDPANIARLIRQCENIEDAISALTTYGDYRAVTAKSEGFHEGLASATRVVDRAFGAAEPFPGKSHFGG